MMRLKDLLPIAVMVLAACDSQDGTGASLPNALPDGAPPCAMQSGTNLIPCPNGAFCMLDDDGFVCKEVPPECTAGPTCICLTQAGAYDCARDLWTCQANDAGAAVLIGCVAN